MKKILYTLLIAFISYFSVGNTFASNSCDQSFNGGYLRYNYTYGFYDNITNTNSSSIFLNSWGVSYINPGYLDSGAGFGWTPYVLSHNYEISGNTSNVRILATGDNNWRIADHPSVRTNGTISSYDFGIMYDITYDFSNNYPNSSDDITHRECIYYSVTWCGDGVVDSGDGEQCDDGNNVNGDGCSATCENEPDPLTYCGDGTVQTPNDDGEYEQCDDGNNVNGDGCSATCETEGTNPICSLLTVTPSSGLVPLNSSFFCSGVNADNYRIYIRNSAGTLINTINGNSGSYLFTNIGTYTATCFVNGSVTSPSCSRTITVTDTPQGPSCGTENGNTYAYDDTTWDTNNFCSSGTPDPNPPVFPGQGATTTWECNGAAGTTPATCSASRGTPPGGPVCGTENGRVYDYNDTTWDTNSFCSSGTPDPNPPVFPGQGATTTWECNGVAGTTPVTCNASRLTPPNPVCVSGGVTGAQSSTISATTPGLCPTGQTVGNFTATTAGSTINYTWTCNGLRGGDCRASYSSGGGTSPTCRDILASGNQVTCIGNRQVNWFKLSCNGEESVLPAIPGTPYGTLTSATFDNCNPSSARCYVSGRITEPDVDYSGWSSTLACNYTSGGGNRCGNGVIEGSEECDLGSANGTPGSACSANCRLNGGGGDPDCRDTNSCTITLPGDGELSFGPIGDIVIGHNVNPFSKIGEKPYIYNNSDYDFSFEELCVKHKEGNSINPKYSLFCQNLPNILYARQKVEFRNTPNFKGNKDGIVSGSYDDNTIVTTIRNEDELYDWAYFAGKLNVRVSKPSIVTAGGGASYIYTPSMANINLVSVRVNEFNKNFAGVWIAGSDIDNSSFSDSTSDSSIVNETSKLGDSYSDNLDTISDDNGDSNGAETLLSKFDSYNGIENVFILKNTNFEINSDLFSGLTGPRTYIISNGNLHINSDISYNDNIAFVLKGGDIFIDKDVTSISGTYISIKDNRGGKITSGETVKQLTVKGSLYGNLDNLIDNRYYIEEQSDGTLSVGTIVSFGSALFRKPAPLVSQFITEYINSQKVAK